MSSHISTKIFEKIKVSTSATLLDSMKAMDKGKEILRKIDRKLKKTE